MIKYCQNCGKELKMVVTAQTNPFSGDSTLYNSCSNCGEQIQKLGVVINKSS